MPVSIFDLFSIGIGPSSSHTVGPMRAAQNFALSLHTQHLLEKIDSVELMLYGSLAYTGVGHGTIGALYMGLMGFDPETIDPHTIQPLVEDIHQARTIILLNQHTIPFNETHLIFNTEELLPHHSNAMRFKAFDANKKCLCEDVYYSVGGGFIVKDSEKNAPRESSSVLPYPYANGAELMQYCHDNNMTISDVMIANEKHWRDEAEIKQQLLRIAQVMNDCIDHGCQAEGILPGGLNVQRRAAPLYKKLRAMGKPTAHHPQVMGWLNAYALAVNEENAAGQRVVTAPTNGAAGIIPSVMRYYQQFFDNATEQGVMDLLLTAGAIGILYKRNASLSGAELGCQGEVGVACSMAAAGLAAALGGTVKQVENAAEIAMEHNLGLTCDPVKGLVQIPCIERNAMGAVKAVNAAHLALAESGEHKVSLDMAINTMREIGMNMNSIYKETSEGGLAVNVPEC